MAEENNKKEQRIIDETNYQQFIPAEQGPSAVSKGGDPLFKNIRASKEQLTELLDETTKIQNWVQRELSNNTALACLEDNNLKEIYFKIKNGFGNYGPIILMGFKTAQGVEIPRLKVYNSKGDVVQVLSGSMAIDEINKRAIEYQNSINNYESIVEVKEESEENSVAIEDYSGNPVDYS